MKNLALLTLLLLAIALPVAADPQLMHGKVAGIEQGDYVHLNFEDDEGETHSFFLSNDSSFQQMIEFPEKFTGREATLRWHTVVRDIPENGGKTEIDEAISIEFGEDD